MSFQSLDLSAELLRVVGEQGYLEATPVQLQAIPPILQGKDVMVSAQTGTGKTAAFTLPLLQRISRGARKPSEASRHAKCPIRALILTPTRELAAQVFESVRTYSKHLSLKSMVAYGGVSIMPQFTKLHRGVDILVATPGRLLDLVNQGAADLSQIEVFVLDEADRMLDMGFIHDIRRVMKLLPQRRQSLLFSATLSQDIKALAHKLLQAPVLIEVARRTTTAERITQIVYPVDRERKRELLSFVIGSKNWRQVLVFTRTKHGANRLSKQLEGDGLSSTAIHGDKTQAARSRALADFKQGKVRVLVATDVAARGLDIDKLPHVVNFDLPNVPEDYVHRVGRTGRANSDGMAISLVSVDELNLLKNIEKILQIKVPQEVIAGYEPNRAIKAAPTKIRRYGNSNGNGSGDKRTARSAQGRKRTKKGHNYSAPPSSPSATTRRRRPSNFH